MTTYRDIEIMEVPAPGSGFIFDIGQCGMICDTAEQAREMIDHALDEECFTYRGIFCWPDADGLLNFTVAGEEFALSMETGRPALERAVRAIIDDALDRRS
jgi:hypothetical protein